MANIEYNTEETIVKVKNLTIKYSDNEVVKDVSFDIKNGQFVSIIGPNGAGKSTVLKAINKNIELSSGTIFVKGRDLKQLSYREKAKIIGFVPQNFNDSFNFSVYDTVSMGRNPYRKRFGGLNSDDRNIIIDCLKKTNIYQYKDNKFTNLSGGEKQRVIIARALAQQPRILILDEATSNLDVHHQLDILELVRSLNREDGITVIAVMHDLNLASRFSDRLILMDRGRISKDGSPEEVLNESVLRKVYNMEMVVRDNKLLSYREVVPLRVRKVQHDQNINIHIICGGGTGEYILQKLYSMRYNITCGILNEGDSDLELCRNMNINCVAENPFSKFSEENIKKNQNYINDSDIIIVTDVAVGPGNIQNIKMIENIKDKKIIILHSSNRDFVNGKYEEIINKLKAYGNVSYAYNLKELFEIVNRWEDI